MISPVIRRAQASDLDEMLELYRHLNPDDPPVGHARAQLAWRDLLASELTVVLVACHDGQILSSCTLIVVPNVTRGARPYALIENVVTHVDFRRNGLGQAVLAAALADAWRADCYKVMLATGSKRQETLRFYEAAGFARDGKTFFQAVPPQ